MQFTIISDICIVYTSAWGTSLLSNAFTALINPASDTKRLYATVSNKSVSASSWKVGYFETRAVVVVVVAFS